MTTDTIDTALAQPRFNLPVAPQSETTLNMLHVPSLASVPFSESDGQAARFRKEIVWDREANDYLMLLGGERVGYACTQSAADTTLDELIFAIRHQDTPGTDCPSCGDLLCEDAAICTACRENGETEMINTALDTDTDPNDIPPPDGPGEAPGNPSDGKTDWDHQLQAYAIHLARNATPDNAAQTAAPDPHKESAGRGIARLMRHDRARFLRCVARVGDNDRLAMAGALESYLTAQPHLFTGAPSAERIMAFWAHEVGALT